MAEDRENEVSAILRRAGHGLREGRGALLDKVYDQLLALARQRMLNERADHTLGATALVHDAWLKLSDRNDLTDCGPSTFAAAAAVAMRRILVDHARARATDKRGGQERRLPVDVLDLVEGGDTTMILELDDAIQTLGEEDARAADVVRLRFYAGLEVAETAEALGISQRTAAREWAFARARLYQLLDIEEASP